MRQTKKILFLLYDQKFKYYILNILLINYLITPKKELMGIGDWGLGIGDWGLGIGPNPQSPIPNPQSPIPMFNDYIYTVHYLYLKKIYYLRIKIKKWKRIN